MANELETLMKNLSDTFTSYVDNAILHSPTFKWALKTNQPAVIPVEATLLIRNYIPQDLLSILKGHVSKAATRKLIILQFMTKFQSALKSEVWFLRR